LCDYNSNATHFLSCTHSYFAVLHRFVDVPVLTCCSPCTHTFKPHRAIMVCLFNHFAIITPNVTHFLSCCHSSSAILCFSVVVPAFTCHSPWFVHLALSPTSYTKQQWYVCLILLSLHSHALSLGFLSRHVPLMVLSPPSAPHWSCLPHRSYRRLTFLFQVRFFKFSLIYVIIFN